MSSIRRTVLTVTVLHPSDEPIEDLALSVIAHACEEGAWLGQYKIVSNVAVPGHEVVDAQLAVGGDGTFFDPSLHQPEMDGQALDACVKAAELSQGWADETTWLSSWPDRPFPTGAEAGVFQTTVDGKYELYVWRVGTRYSWDLFRHNDLQPRAQGTFDAADPAAVLAAPALVAVFHDAHEQAKLPAQGWVVSSQAHPEGIVGANYIERVVYTHPEAGGAFSVQHDGCGCWMWEYAPPEADDFIYFGSVHVDTEELSEA